MVERQLDAVLAELVIRDRFGRRRIRYGRRFGPLVLQLEAADDTIRSWPEEYYRKYSGVLPINEPGETPAAGAPREGPERQVADELLDIAQGCGYDGRPAYRLPIVFPRFAAAYAVLIAWQPDEEGTRAELDAELETRVKQAIGEARRDVLPELRKRFGGLSRDPYIEQQLSGLAGLGIRLLGALRFPHFRTVRWYRKKGFGTQPPRTTRVLIKELRRWRRKPPAEQELLLVEALLADIDAHYGVVRRLNRARRPVILLPGVDRVPARRKIRDTLLAAYDGKCRDLRTHPVVIATSAPDGAPPARGANAPVTADELKAAIPALFTAREEAAEERRLGKDVPLPSRLLQVAVEPSGREPDGTQRSARPGPGPVTVTAAWLVMAGALGYGLSLPIGPPESESCGERLEVVGADCVGVSDGTGVFMPDIEGMRDVFARIEAENNRIATRKHATVALMIPMESDIPAVREQILSEVQGAFLAQLQANKPDAAMPPIRLVLANPGRDYRQWRHTVNKLTQQEPALRVVAGFNLSLGNTWHAMSHLTKVRRIPVVAGLVTSGDFANPETQDRDGDPFPGLARVVSTAKEQADALLKFDPKLAGAETALVVDTRPMDNYNDSLRAAFTEARKGNKGTGVQDMTFESPGLEEAGITPNRFEDFALNICQSNARFVYFAGRAFHLKLFVKKLAGTYCSGKESYTVISGSDATTLDSRLDDDERRLLRGDPGGGKPAVSVEYAAPAHPDAWSVEIQKWSRHRSKPRKEDIPRYLAEPQEALDELRAGIAAAKIGDVRLEDGRTIITHDVVLTAAKELAKAAAVSNTEVPSAEHVREILTDLNAAYRVRGASGWICLTNAGNPYDKALSVVRLDPAADELRLEGVAWPEGEPPKNNCVVPQATP
ncbi:hypothetical protein [Streptosporangium sp. KLBMP 9127]|nr:hypothetical protein [Streptosporangium sp. KLBMP 9127]